MEEVKQIEALHEKLQITRHKKPYRKDSGFEITKDNPYIVFPHLRFPKQRKKPTKSQYSQFIGEYDSVHHKFVVKKHIIHDK